MGRVGDMDTIPFKSLFTVAVMVWWVGSSGCSSIQATPTSTLPAQSAALSEGQPLPSSLEAPISVETFLAFCDRA